MGPDWQERSRRHLCEQEVSYAQDGMSDNEMYVKNTFTIGGLFILLIALIVAGIEVHEYQETMKMQSCVSAGKEWTLVQVDKDYSPDRACIDKVDNK